MRNNEGYSDITIPAQKIRTCSGCKYYSHSMVKSGNDPIYANNCTHLDVAKNDAHYFSIFSVEGNLTENQSGYVVTPEWCPFLIKPKT